MYNIVASIIMFPFELIAEFAQRIFFPYKPMSKSDMGLALNKSTERNKNLQSYIRGQSDQISDLHRRLKDRERKFRSEAEDREKKYRETIEYYRRQNDELRRQLNQERLNKRNNTA